MGSYFRWVLEFSNQWAWVEPRQPKDFENTLHDGTSLGNPVGSEEFLFF